MHPRPFDRLNDSEKDALRKWERALEAAAIASASRIANWAASSAMGRLKMAVDAMYHQAWAGYVATRAASFGAAIAAAGAASWANSAVRPFWNLKTARAWARRVMQANGLTVTGGKKSRPDLSKVVTQNGTRVFSAPALRGLKYPEYAVLLGWCKTRGIHVFDWVGVDIEMADAQAAGAGALDAYA